MSEAGPAPKELISLWETLAVEDGTMRVDMGATELMAEPAARGKAKELRRRSLRSLPRISRSQEPREVAGELFLVKEVLGAGGMGVVELATQASLSRDVALKKLKQERSVDDDARFSLLREAWVTGLLEHPNIIPVHTIGSDENDEPLMVMKLVEGVSWADTFSAPELLPGYKEGKDFLDLHLRVLMQVCNAVEFAHSKGVIHRDLKPENVMIGSYGEVYVVDWGLAVSLKDDGSGRLPLARDANQVCGTPVYMAPEMAAGEGSRFDERTDVYLLGAILHELITGEPRHEGRTMMAIMMNAYQSDPVEYGEEIPAELGGIANQATARESENRYQSVGAFREALDDYFTHRESYRLVEEGRERLEELERQGKRFIENFDGEEELPARIYELFSECRFALQQALRIWNANQGAKRARERLLIAMGELELLVGDEKAASKLLEEMEEIPEYLEERLQALREERAAEDEELWKLKQLREAVDINMASRDRALASFVLGWIMGPLPILSGSLVKRGWLEFSYLSYSIQWVVVLLVVGTVFGALRKKIIRNRINKMFVIAIFAMLMAMGLMRVLAFLHGLPVEGALALNKAGFGISALLIGASMDRRIVPPSLLFCAGAIAISLWPGWGLEIDGVTTMAGLWLMAGIWYRGPNETK